ncbi:MAG: TraR/DksA C4-type zinc finger protein [Gammaproteobacteria bacterium]|nr:TraR/DksA C4-type zinc finger protein [Gammaproteobacteria bacterium]
MTASKSSKKDEKILGTFELSGASGDKQKLKTTLPKKRNPMRRARVVHRRTPNIDAATELVTQAVATSLDTRENSKPQAKVPESQILAGGDDKKALTPAARKRNRETIDTENQSALSATKKPTTRRRAPRDQSTGRQAETQPTQKKPTGRPSQQRSRAAKRVSEPVRVKPERAKADTAPKKTTSKSSKRTPKKTATKPIDRVASTAEQLKRKPRVKRKPRKTLSKTAASSSARHAADMANEDYVIGFQGIYYKPYRLTNKDLFMSGAQQDHFMDILIRAKEKLLAEEVDRASQLQENDASNLPDPLDQGTNEGVFHNQLRTRDRESQLVRKINRAIDCLKTGSYGYCEACGCEIPIRRLEARPIVTKCIDCKERDELRERQLGQ